MGREVKMLNSHLWPYAQEKCARSGHAGMGVEGDNRNCGGGRARGFSATAPRWHWVCPRLKVNFPLGLGLPGNSLGTNVAFREF